MEIFRRIRHLGINRTWVEEGLWKKIRNKLAKKYE